MCAKMRPSSYALAVLVAVTVSCTDRTQPDASVLVAGPSPAVPPPSLPTTVPGVLSIAMPVEPGDTGNTAFGIVPFGYHGVDHSEDGHPGWDIEYRVGATVRAAAAGIIESVFPDPFSPGRSTVQIEHVVGTHHYRTVYTNIQALAADIAASQPVRAGQPIGIAGTVTATIGTQTVTYAMTHFQVDDFEYYREIPNPNAVSPEAFLTAQARSFFDALWAHATYAHELVEPFVSNPRELRFPASRTWMRAGGDGPAGIRFTRRTSRTSTEYDYALLAESGSVVEAGTATISPARQPIATIDLVSPTAVRVGVYDIISNEMRLTLAPPGAARPTDLGSASVYRTTR